MNKYYKEDSVRHRLGVTRKSSETDNVFRDIDCYWLHGGWKSVSVKVQNAAKQTGYVCFELEVLMNDTWKVSWFSHSKADFYAILVGKSLFVVPRGWLKSYVDRNGWAFQSRLKSTTKDRQNRLSHPHVDAKLGFLPMEVLQKWRFPYHDTIQEGNG